MSAKKIQNKSNKLTANDLRLKRFVELTDKIKEMNAELKEIKEELLHKGSFSTSNYVVLVDERSRKQAPSLKTLIEIYGNEVEEHCQLITYQTVKVSQKGGQ